MECMLTQNYKLRRTYGLLIGLIIYKENSLGKAE